jgi:hypothetical protein
MNLMEVQSKLNKLPPLPESIQYLTSAAQGGNPQVPPYMALARISEINKEIQSGQQTQPPAEPLNQSLPKQALQSMGIGALLQGQPAPQGMPQQSMPPQGMPQGAQPAPQMQMPQQGARPMPQQAPRPMPQGAQPVRMAADGGLMSLPVDPRMFEYGSGGVVAFNGEDGDQQVEAESGYDAETELRKLMPQIQTLLKQDVRPIRTRAEIETGLNKDYGVDEGPIGKGYLEGLASLKEAKAADRAKQEQDLALRRRLASSKGLLDYSDASRGQTGLGGIGALGRNYIGSVDKFAEEEAGLRQSGIKVDELLNEAQYKVQALRQAQKDGDIKAEQKADLDLSKIAKDLGVAKSTLIGRLATGNLNLMGKETMAGSQEEAARIRAAAKNAAGNKPPKVTDQAAGVAAIAARLKEEHEDWTDAQVQAEAVKQYKQMSGAPNVAAKVTKDINDAWRKEKYTVDYIEAPDKVAYEREWRANWKRANPDAAAPAPAPAVAKPAQVLPPGTTTGKVVPGKGTEVFKDGKLIGYAN